jgi:hypothetical protein
MYAASAKLSDVKNIKAPSLREQNFPCPSHSLLKA